MRLNATLHQIDVQEINDCNILKHLRITAGLVASSAPLCFCPLRDFPLPTSCVGWGFSLFDSTGNLEQRQTDLGLTSRLITTDQKIPDKNIRTNKRNGRPSLLILHQRHQLATYLAYKH